MAQVEAWLWDRLKNYDDIVAIIGTNVFPQFAPQDLDLPFITFSLSDTQRSYNAKQQDGIPRSTFDINCWDDDFPRLMTLKDAVRTAIDGYRIDDGTHKIRRSFIEDEKDIPDAADWGFEEPTYGRQFVLVVSHVETVPTYT